MTKHGRPRRSVLYMPGSNERALEKGKSLAADGLILDLEDAVTPSLKADARVRVIDAIDNGGYGMREVLVRANGLQTEWGFEDIVAIAASKADGILLPKVESADAIRMCEQIMYDNGAHDHMRIWCMIETPRGVLNAERMAAASRRMGGFVMGTSDLAKDVHAAHTRDRLPMLYSLGHCLLVARAYGLAILDGVHLDLSDSDGFVHSCEQGMELGFDGKTLIHPKTIDQANRVFAPQATALDWAQRIIDAFAEAQGKGEGVVVVDGKLVENLHVEEAKRLVALGEAIKSMEQASGATPPQPA